MGAVTYPDMQVAALLNENFVPVQVNIEAVAKLANDGSGIGAALLAASHSQYAEVDYSRE